MAHIFFLPHKKNETIISFMRFECGHVGQTDDKMIYKRVPRQGKDKEHGTTSRELDLRLKKKRRPNAMHTVTDINWQR